MLTKQQQEFIRAIVNFQIPKFKGINFSYDYFDEEAKYWFENHNHKVTVLEINNYIKELRSEKNEGKKKR
jgi:hypothetical protein